MADRNANRAERLTLKRELHMAQRKKIAKMRNLISSTDRLFAALQRVDEKVDTFIAQKADTLEAVESSIDQYTSSEQADASVN